MSAASYPSVTVIIPCFNDAQFLPRALQSVIAQSTAAHQIFIVDDGSTDTTHEVCRSFEARGVRMHYIYQANAGVSSARNNGIRHANGEYVIFLDADDELLPNAITNYQSAIRKSPCTDPHWLIGASESVGGKTTRKRRISIHNDLQAAFAAYVRKELHLGNISNMCFRRSTIAAFEFPEALRFSEDFVVFALLLSHYRPVVLQQFVAREHRRPHSLRSTVNLQTLLTNDVEGALFDSPHLPQAYDRFRSDYVARFAHSVTKRAYREGAYEYAAHWYATMIHHQPRRLFNLKLLLRYLRSRLLTRRDFLQQSHKHGPNLR